MILHDDRVAYEKYPRMRGNDRHILYQWQVYEDGSFFKGGFAGQGLYIDPDRDIVLAYVGTHGYGEVSPSPLEVCLHMFAELY